MVAIVAAGRRCGRLLLMCVVVCCVPFDCLVGGVECCSVFACVWYVLLVFATCGSLMLLVVGVGCVVFLLSVACLFPSWFDSWWCIVVDCKSLCAACRCLFSACWLLFVGRCLLFDGCLLLYVARCCCLLCVVCICLCVVVVVCCWMSVCV